jgi:hypothetical protein
MSLGLSECGMKVSRGRTLTPDTHYGEGRERHDLLRTGLVTGSKKYSQKTARGFELTGTSLGYRAYSHQDWRGVPYALHYRAT